MLERIENPEDLKRLREEELPFLCDELRRFIIEAVSTNPGHLGASLGTVELAVALHYVFKTPYDKVIWDVGHQAYAHKILTGRRDKFHTNRTYHGISGFPKMSESEYDAFGTGHSSTSVSAALGMAEASRLKGEKDRQHVAVIGDGAMTGGMAVEALNNAGVSQANLLVILNDNGIAIDSNRGALKKYLTDISVSRAYNRLKDRIWMMMGGNTRYGANSRAVVKQFGNALKTTIFNKSNLFEALSVRYFGPVDGHDVIHLVKLLKDLRDIPGPKLLHIITIKGKGLGYAEKDQTTYHAPGTFDVKTGEIAKDPCSMQAPKYQTVFGRTIIELAEQNPLIIGITPAMATGSSLNLMMNMMPDRTFDVGIAEQHAVTFSAGLAAAGMIPFCNIYSTFMQRGYDQLIHDVALQQLHVVFCLDRGGLVGEDGPTHHGAFDLAYLRAIPGITIAAPMDEEELRNLMYTAQLPGIGPFAIRYPRGRGNKADWKTPFRELPVGKGRRISDGGHIAILSIGTAGNHVAATSGILRDQGIEAAHYDLRYLKPLDEELLHEVFGRFKKIITVEDGTINGGMGSAVLEFMADRGYEAQVRRLGIPDRFIGSGRQEELYAECGFDSPSIVAAAETLMKTATR